MEKYKYYLYGVGLYFIINEYMKTGFKAQRIVREPIG